MMSWLTRWTDGAIHIDTERVDTNPAMDWPGDFNLIIGVRTPLFIRRRKCKHPTGVNGRAIKIKDIYILSYCCVCEQEIVKLGDVWVTK